MQPFVEWRGGQRREQAKDGEARRPSTNLIQGALGDSGRVVVHSKDERSDGVYIAAGEALEDGGVFAGLVEALVDGREVCRIDGLHADEDPFAARGRDEVYEFGVAQEIGADLGDPMDLCAGADDIAEKRFGALDVDGEIVVNEEDGNL